MGLNNALVSTFLAKRYKVMFRVVLVGKRFGREGREEMGNLIPEHKY